MAPKVVVGTYPFGSKLQLVEQKDRSPKKVFVLGVYASAVHAVWIGPDDRVRVRALAVASEPEIFWRGEDAAERVAAIPLRSAAGRLEPASDKLNGPSGRSLDHDYLEPLGVTRARAWLCDLVPHTCLNDSQAAAIQREYEPRRKKLGLRVVELPAVPRLFADDARRAEVLREIEESKAGVIVLLGDQPIRHFLAHHVPGHRRLADFGKGSQYGRLHPVTLAGREYQVLPLAHPRQVSGLGAHSSAWRSLHASWVKKVAPTLLAQG
jgi:hypothetical protein